MGIVRPKFNHGTVKGKIQKRGKEGSKPFPPLFFKPNKPFLSLEKKGERSENATLSRFSHTKVDKSNLVMPTQKAIDNPVYRKHLVENNFCLICYCPAHSAHHVKQVGRSGVKDDSTCVPLCFDHHREVHDKADSKLMKLHTIDELLDIAMRFYEAYSVYE